MVDEFDETNQEQPAHEEEGDTEGPMIPIAEPNPSSPDKHNAKEQTNRTTEYIHNAINAISRPALWCWRHIKNASLLTALATIAIAITSYYQWQAIKGQLHEMESSSSQTDRIICAANKIEADLDTANKQNQEAMKVSNRQSKMALDASIAASRLDQRAWLGPAEALPPEFIEGQKRIYMKEGESASYGFIIANTGKTPAINVRQSTSYLSLPASTKFAPRYPGGTTNTGVIQPNARVWAKAPNTGTVFKPVINGVTTGTWKFYVFGEIVYDDVFGIEHHTTFCYYLLPNLTAFTSCKTYNEED
jgi:hypothetical protein